MKHKTIQGLKGLLVMIIAVILRNQLFNWFVDPYIVPLVGMRPLVAVITAIVFLVPAFKISKDIAER